MKNFKQTPKSRRLAFTCAKQLAAPKLAAPYNGVTPTRIYSESRWEKRPDLHKWCV